MKVLEFQTLIEQDVQKMSSFAYEDMLPEEVDIQANKAFYIWLDSFANFQPRGNRLDDTEARLNDIRTLIVRDSPLSLASTGSVSVASFPEDYLYLVGIKMQILFECSNKKQESILPNKKYILKSDSLVYNSHTYSKGDLIIGTTTQLLGKSDVVHELSNKLSSGRIVRSEELDLLNTTFYGRTHEDSPLVGADENGIYISTLNKFFIESSKIIYIRKPREIDSSIPNDDIDLPINGCYKLAQLTVEAILRVTEQPQQKIENLKLTK